MASTCFIAPSDPGFPRGSDLHQQLKPLLDEIFNVTARLEALRRQELSRQGSASTALSARAERDQVVASSYGATLGTRVRRRQTLEALERTISSADARARLGSDAQNELGELTRHHDELLARQAPLALEALKQMKANVESEELGLNAEAVAFYTKRYAQQIEDLEKRLERERPQLSGLETAPAVADAGESVAADLAIE